MVVSHRRHWEEVRRRRGRYGYGPLAIVREWWGERRPRPPSRTSHPREA